MVTTSWTHSKCIQVMQLASLCLIVDQDPDPGHEGRVGDSALPGHPPPGHCQDHGKLFNGSSIKLNSTYFVTAFIGWHKIYIRFGSNLVEFSDTQK